MADDVDGLEVCGLRARVEGSEPLIRLRNTRRAWIQNAQPAGDIEAFLAVHGAQSADITVTGSDLRGARSAVASADGFTGAVAQSGNLSPR